MENMEEENLDVSVVVPISERHDNLNVLYKIYADELEKLGKSFEFIFVIDGNFPVAFADLNTLLNEGNPVKIIKFPKVFGESTALEEGFRRAKGNTILTLASYIQIEPRDLEKIFSAYNGGNDLIITRRYPRKDPWINRVQSKIYHYIVRKLTDTDFQDITSGMRLINRKILSEFVLYGDLHRFIPIFAVQKGINVREVNVTQRKEDTQVRIIKPGAYLRRLLDILTLFFLVKFTKRPLRFFGLIGVSLFLPGFMITFYLGFLRLINQIALYDRTLLLLGILLMVFGIQIFSVGLVGELIIFGQSRPLSDTDYRVQNIIE